MMQRRSPRPAAAWAILAAGLAAALTGPVSQPAAAGQAADPASGRAEAIEQRRVNVNFTEAPVADVTTALSLQSGVNVALSQSVKGTVTVRLMDVPLDEALRKVANIVGADVRRFGNTYFVGSRAELKAIAANTGASQMWAPRWAKAEDLKPLLESALPYLTVEATKSNFLVLRGDPADIRAALDLASRADVQPATAAPTPASAIYTVKHVDAAALVADARKAYPNLEFQLVNRAIVVRGNPADVQQATSILQGLDVQNVQNVQEEKVVARTYRLKYLHPIQTAQSLAQIFKGLSVSAGPEQYGPRRPQLSTITLEGQETFGGGSGGSQSQQGQDQSEQELARAGQKARHLVLVGPAELVEAALQVLEETDVAPDQVLIEARVLDISPDRLRDIGVTWEWGTLGFRIPGSNANVEDLGSPSGSAGRFGKLVRFPFEFDATINLLEQRREAKLLASPKIAVLDNEEASIFIGDLLRFRTLASVTTGGSEQFTVEEVPVGIALLVRPRVNTNGEITLKVHPTVSTVTGFVGPENIPQTASREADSTIRVRDGETVVIGGLLREEEIRTMSKIPGLGDLPLLGRLFKSRRLDRRKSEITVFLTVRLLK